MTLQEAINHTKYWNGDSGLQSCHYDDGSQISLKIQFSPEYREHIEFTRNGKPATYSQMPKDGWE